MIGAFLIAGISIGFVIWGFKTGQFVDNADMRRKALEEDEEDES
jgi:cbb3-type cytochrome oxidase maturation protein